MKIKYFLYVIIFPVLTWESSIYDIEVNTIEGNSISMSSFANKKIIISPFDAATPNISWLQLMDSIQSADPELRIIGVPGNDFSGIGNDVYLANLKTTHSLDFILLKSTYVKKVAGNNQNALFRWLTNVSDNNHFDNDVESAGQLFIISNTGVLYSVLSSDVPLNILYQVLNQN